MRENTKKRKKATQDFSELQGKEWMTQKMVEVMTHGKQAFDQVAMEMGKMLAEAIMQMEKEEIAGPDYAPRDPDIQKWASQAGSVYIGGQKQKVERPRLRHRSDGEMLLQTYEKLKERDGFSEELLVQVLEGLSTQKYSETVTKTAGGFGVSSSAASQHIVEATTKKLREFKERDLSGIRPFAVFLDTVHRGGHAFVVALGVDVDGQKQPLGFWQGASENHEVCEELFKDLERRGLALSNQLIWITDGGTGLIKALKQRYGAKLQHVRCLIHKSRNLQNHLPKKYRKTAHEKLKAALEQNNYKDARQMLKELEKWLRTINESAADSLNEALEQLLTLHRLKVPRTLRKTLSTTNPIESMFSQVRDGEANVKRSRGPKMTQRWLAAVLMHAEQRFRTVKGFREIPGVIEAIKKEQEQSKQTKQKGAA